MELLHHHEACHGWLPWLMYEHEGRYYWFIDQTRYHAGIIVHIGDHLTQRGGRGDSKRWVIDSADETNRLAVIQDITLDQIAQRPAAYLLEALL